MRWAIWTLGALGLIWLMYRFASWQVDRQILLLVLACVWVIVFVALVGADKVNSSRARDVRQAERMAGHCAMIRASYVRQHGEVAALARETENPNIWADIVRSSQAR